ncbi:MAG: dihydroorotate dehydrogenase B (NAD(+)), electron transfer subunit [Planctomycetota bacterium]|nr:MAG: dihydroorotate dehydrogenase B (NAD(+)), electron transfer subunit [Planctomycetota bacterium]
MSTAGGAPQQAPVPDARALPVPAGLREITAARPAVFEAEVTARRPLGGRGVLLSAYARGVAVVLRPGEFLTARAWPGLDPLLRRPLAPFDVQLEAGGTRIDLLLLAGGRGTRLLAALEPGERLSLLGPLGRPFSPPRPGRLHVLVGGGVGIAPLHHLAREACAADSRIRLQAVIGARTAALLFGADELQALGVPLTLATEQGDRGLCGTAIEALEQLLERLPEPPLLYGCGPEGMLLALVRLARARGLGGEVSLERHMACGFGVCYTCACRVIEPDGAVRRVRSCLAGPVFPIAALPEDGW